MAHYALLDENNVVVEVITGVDESETQIDSDGTQVGGSTENWEQFYESRPWFTGLKCKRTSYNTVNGKKINRETNQLTTEPGFRGRYAQVGMLYDKILDAFIYPQPYTSWIFNEDIYDWEAPVPYPNDGKDYLWDEESVSWKEI